MRGRTQMPVLKPSTALWNHIFGINNSNRKKLSGFHSTAIVSEERYSKAHSKDTTYPKIKRTFGTRSRCYLCGWNYYPSKESPKKWSTMFPDGWDEDKVKAAVSAAIADWNLYNNPVIGTQNVNEILGGFESLNRRYNITWNGRATVDSYVYCIGGKKFGGDKVGTAYPLMGANTSFPVIDFDEENVNINEDVEADD
jgi:hypothetical protein